uniref:Uncharacterized protein n=1 Tax=Arundo donax TaxID=35708 RepID=A0A0A8XUL1_ARUDO
MSTEEGGTTWPTTPRPDLNRAALRCPLRRRYNSRRRPAAPLAPPATPLLQPGPTAQLL